MSRTTSWQQTASHGLRGVATIIAAGVIAFPSAGQTGTITGLVSDAASGQLLESALVRVSDLERGTVLTNTAGRYVVTGVPAGTYEVTFVIIGYEDLTVEVSVAAGATAVYDAAMEAQALALQELIVTGVARATPKVKLPFTVEKLDVADIPVPAISAESFLVGKAPGIKVARGSGQPGSTGSILLRGATSIDGGQSPLVIIDGVISGTAFDDLSALDIESMEIIKGAAGASLYGSRAANGVVMIRTKRGAGFGGQDFRQISGRGEYGMQSLPGTIQLSQNHPWKTDAAGNLVDNDGNVIPDFSDPDANRPALRGTNVYTSFQDGQWPSALPLYDQVERVFGTGELISGYAATEGRHGATNYRGSFERQSENGVLSQYNEGFVRKGFRLNVDHEVLDNLNVSLSSSYNEIAQEDLGSAPFYDLTFMGPYVDLLKRDPATIGARHCPANGCLYVNPDPLSNQDNPLYHFELIDFHDAQENIGASANVNWMPFSWMDIDGVFGLDRRSFHEINYSPPGRITAEGAILTGTYGRYQEHRSRVNGEFTVSANKSFSGLTARARARYLQESDHREWFSASGSDFVAADVPRLNNLDPDSYGAGSYIRDIVSEGYFLIGALDYNGKYILDGLGRRDGSSLFGANQRWQTYYRASAAWRVAQETWWPLSAVGEFKLRWSIGTAGRRPGFSAQYETYSVGGGTITPVTLGNKELKPQRSTEHEFGVDMVLFNRLSTTFNYATTNSTDQILTVPLPKAGGFGSQVQNAGTLNSKTWEFSVETPVIETPELGWTVRLNLDRSRSRVTELGRPPFRNNFFYYRDDEVFGAFYGAKWASSCEDLPTGVPCNQFQINDDGLLVWVGSHSYTDGVSSDLWGSDSKGQTGDDLFQWGMPIRMFGECETRRQGDPGCKDFLYLGNSTPDVNVSFTSSFRWKGLTLYALFDGERGATVYNQTRQWAYRENRSGDQDQLGKDPGLKKPVAYYQTLYNTNAMNGWFVEDGSFVKLRELSLRYSLTPSLLDRLTRGRVSAMDINLIGRNLYIFSDYTGYDPEVGNNNGGSQVIGRVDDYQYPNFRTISASIDLVF